MLVALAVLVFLNPIWVGFEQARTGADRFTGYTLDDVHRVTNAVLGELIFGPATFLQPVAGVGGLRSARAASTSPTCTAS